VRRTFETNKWLIVHEQVSVPVDLRNGKAMMDLKPVTFHLNVTTRQVAGEWMKSATAEGRS
jgi:hypothetical protein